MQLTAQSVINRLPGEWIEHEKQKCKNKIIKRHGTYYSSVAYHTFKSLYVYRGIRLIAERYVNRQSSILNLQGKKCRFVVFECARSLSSYKNCALVGLLCSRYSFTFISVLFPLDHSSCFALHLFRYSHLFCFCVNFATFVQLRMQYAFCVHV